ncbi:MAG: hypothetical protein Q9M92_17410 [Enterobacterales bacterium]|nr:hypothetical protein [Enterobacterales bacterium]
MIISLSLQAAEEKKISIQIQQQNDQDAKVELSINDLTENFTLSKMEIGETQTLVTDSGSTVIVSKNKDGIILEIAGNEIKLPNIGNEMSAHIIKAGMPLHTDNFDGIQVFGDLTEEQISIIKQAFTDAGVEKEVKFSKGLEMAFFSIDDGEGQNIDLQLGDSDGENHWVSDNGKEVKLIKMGDSKMHINSKIIVIKTEEDN